MVIYIKSRAAPSTDPTTHRLLWFYRRAASGLLVDLSCDQGLCISVKAEGVGGRPPRLMY